MFAIAAMGKLADRRGARRALADFGVPAQWHGFAVWLLPLAELATAVALLVDRSARWGALAALALLAGFSAGIATALARGRQPDCHCFGRLSSARIGRRTLVRNAVLALPALVVAVGGPGGSASAWVVAAVVPAALLVAFGPGHRLVHRPGTIGEQPAGDPPGPLPIGAPAPRFALPTLDGRPTSLEALLEPGTPLALVFYYSGCGSCVTMVPDLARWQTALADRLTIALVAGGTTPDIRRLTEEHGLKNVLVETGTAVSEAYSALATPSAVIIDPGGRIASRTMGTSVMVEALIRRAISSAAPGAAPATPGLTIEFA
jgi:peroxiredoxin